MIPTVLLVAFVAGLVVPQRWAWWLGVAVASALAWGVVVAFLPDANPAIALGGVGLGLANAVVGVAIAAALRWAFSPRRHRRRAA